MEVESYQPSFGAVKYTIPKSKLKYYIATKVGSVDQSIEGDKLLTKLENAQGEVELYPVREKNGKKKLAALIGNKIYTENFFVGPLTVLRRALKAIKKLSVKHCKHPNCEQEV